MLNSRPLSPVSGIGEHSAVPDVPALVLIALLQRALSDWT